MSFSNRGIRLSMVVGITLAVCCAVHPVHNRLLQAGFLFGVALVWIALFVRLARHRKSRVLMIGLPLLTLIPFVLPGRTIDSQLLRADYVARMRGFDGVKYVWGGESPLGIDCSGLPRRSLADALWAEGWRHANGTAFRKWLDQWSFDSSAFAMSQGYRGRTRALGISGPLWELDQAPIQPGDLAVRGDGGHVVIYLGDHEWIEADPTSGKVHIWRSTVSDGAWYEQMTLHRWVDCDDASPPRLTPAGTSR